MAAHIAVSANVLTWAFQQSGRHPDDLLKKFPKWNEWLVSGSDGPTIKQLEKFAKFTGVPLGYLFLDEPPNLQLPIADFREGHDGGRDTPSSDLLAVLHLSIRRQEWYQAYALDNDLPVLPFVGSASNDGPRRAAAQMRAQLNFEVETRTGDWTHTRKHLIDAFEALGGLTVTTSMVENNTYRPLDPDEFRGFSLVDDRAPLVFVNAAQTLNGQIFTLAHEFAHVWRGKSGISAEDPRREPSGELEAWCNAVASEFLVPELDLVQRYPSTAKLADRLDRLARVYKCGTLVVLQAIRRAKLEKFVDFAAVYDEEVKRLRAIQRRRSAGGGHYLNQPFRIGRRLSRALIGDAIEGRTRLADAMGLMSMRSISTFDEYARRLGVI